MALTMSNRNAIATIADLHNVNRVLENVEMKESQVCYGYVGKKEDFKLIGIGDALYKMSEKAICGTVLLLANNNLMRASLIQWMSKKIERVCKSSKDTEALVMNRLVEDAVFAAR